ncbi:MAG: LCP family protein [Bacilli bacterium]|nr:LCP family protein [Bacilli bacterium]
MAKKEKKSKKRIITIISKIIYSLLVILSVLAVGIILSLKILPLKYVIPGMIVIFILFSIMGYFIFKVKFKSWIRIIIDIISLILIAGISFGLYYLNQTLNFMDKIKADDYQIEEYYVLVLDDSKYKDLEDIKDEKLGTYPSTELDNYTEALDTLSNKVITEEKEYDNYMKTSQALLDNDVEAILLSSAYKTIVDEELEDFENNVRILYTISIKVKTETTTEEVDVTNDSFNIYISGIDIYGDISLVSRSDVNMIVSVNPTTNKILLTSIPRDYYVQLHGTTGYKDKLTHAGIYGIDMSINTIEDLLDIDIDYYVRVNFTTLISLVDAIGGIDIYSDTAFTAWTNPSCTYKVGTNYLDGKCALAFARERKAYSTGDRHRVQNQQDVLKAILTKALSSKTLITKYTAILKSLGYSFQTSIPSDKIYELINNQLNTMPSWNIEQISLNGSDSHAYTYSYRSQKLYVMEPDYKTVAAAQTAIKAIEAGN